MSVNPLSITWMTKLPHFTVVYLATKPLIRSKPELRWSCCNRDQYLLSMITKKFTFEKQQHLYQNKVTLCLTPVQRFGNQAHNCKMEYKAMNRIVGWVLHSPWYQFHRHLLGHYLPCTLCSDLCALDLPRSKIIV